MKSTRLRPPFAACVCLCILTWIPASTDLPAPDGIVVANARLRITLDGASGVLAGFIDQESGFDFIEKGGKDTDLWQIRFMPGSNPGTLGPSSARSFRGRLVGGKREAAELRWEGFGIDAAPSLRIIARVELDAQLPSSRWSLSVEGLGSLNLEQVRFPRIPDITRQPDERLAVPVWMGQITDRPRQYLLAAPGARWEWPYPGTLSLQCLALYRDGGPGLYLSTDDARAYRKAFAFQGAPPEGLGYEVIDYPDASTFRARNYSIPYRAVVGAFRGDWITAAERYRSWGLRQPWALRSRRALGLTPAWLLDTGAWIWNRGRSEGVLLPAAALGKELGLPVSVFWHWWHGCPYDVGFPEYLPPREGTDAFKSALDEAHAQGLKAIVYMNQRLWGMSTKSWEERGAERYAVKNVQRKVQPEVYNIYMGLPCASMCMGTSFWRDTYAGLADRAVRELGVDGIYMDQACSNLLCYDPSHGHPLGGGVFWMQGFRSLSEEIRRSTRNVRKVLLAGEGAGEAWLPYLDLMLTLQVSQERYAPPRGGWEVIPFFQAVYHACSVTYGSYSSLAFPPYDDLWPLEFAPKERLTLLDPKYSRQFHLEQARSFVWGVQPTIANFLPSHPSERPAEIRFLLQLARLRHKARKFLQDGTWLRPPALDCPKLEVEISRVSIYAGQRGASAPGGNPAARGYSKTVPSLLAGAWRAKDGGLGIALVNIAESPQTARLRLDPAYYGLGPGAKANRVTETSSDPIAGWNPGGPLEVPLPARSACLVELVSGYSFPNSIESRIKQ